MRPLKYRFSPRGSKLVGILIGLTAIMAATACADLQNVDAAVVNGILQNVDSVSGEVTVQLKDGTTTTFNLEDVDIGALQTIAGSAVLQPGDNVELTLDEDDSVTSLSPSTARADGIIVGIDVGASTLTVESTNGVEFTVNVTADTEIEGDDQGSGLTALSTGMAVEVKYDPDSSTASDIEIKGPDKPDTGKGDEEGDDEEQEVRGLVSSIDTTAGTVSVIDENGDESTFTVLPATEIDVDGPAPLSAVQPGSEAKIEYDPRSMEALEIEIAEVEEVNDEDVEDGVDGGHAALGEDNEDDSANPDATVEADDENDSGDGHAALDEDNEDDSANPDATVEADDEADNEDD